MSSSADPDPTPHGPPDPTLSEPTLSEPVPAEPVPAEPALSEPAPTAPVPAAPESAAPVPAAPAEAPGWDVFAERPVPDGLGRDVHLEVELAGMLQRGRDDLARDRGRTAQETTDNRHALYELASFIGRLEQHLDRAEAPLVEGGNKKLYDTLRVLKDQMLDSLRDRGVEVRDPLGHGHDEVAEWADVVHWRRGPQFTGEVVAQTLEPAVFHREGGGRDEATDDHEKVVRRARVVMGCPEPDQT
ncbi:hypothetical protein AB0H86_41350 [Streptomyces sp. NPDC050997]|uniref:hypothetical protein n=1 Tax=Streptomyces sp. NPDC050997 TaxID=3155519 RepID=UPI00343AEBD9